MKYFFGPMSKNVVDTILDFSLKNSKYEMTFIPSRRQIEHDGGYVNNWTTEEFVKYVKSINPNVKIERDHGGPGQGNILDDGYDSLREDAKYMDIIHIDPWKQYPILEEGISSTISMIQFCHNLRPDLEYEIGTEEAIRPYSVEELELIIKGVERGLDPVIFQQIKFAVIQCGTRLSQGNNIGTFDGEKLKKMVDLTKKYGLVAKEHNGDWVPLEIHQEKEKYGLTCVNIAPEMGKIESMVILERFHDNTDDFLNFYRLCIESGKWKKWVTPDFDFVQQKEEIILISGHYVFSHPEFAELKQKYPDMDSEIQSRIYKTLLKYYGES